MSQYDSSFERGGIIATVSLSIPDDRERFVALALATTEFENPAIKAAEASVDIVNHAFELAAIGRKAEGASAPAAKQESSDLPEDLW